MQTFHEIERCIEKERVAIEMSKKAIKNLRNEYDSLKRKQAAEPVPENLVQRARRLKQESENAATLAADNAAKQAFIDFEAPILEIEPDKLRAFYDAMITEILKSVPLAEDTWIVKVLEWTKDFGVIQKSLINAAGLSLNLLWNPYVVHRGRTRFLHLICFALKKFKTEGLSIKCKYNPPLPMQFHSNMIPPRLELICRAV